MAEIHWQTQTAALTEIAQSPRFGLFSDFDGTLCQFVAFPAMPQISERIHTRLEAFSARLPLVAVLSGRAAPELRDLVGLAHVMYVGNHGLEALRDGQLVVIEDAARWEERLSAFAHDLGQPTIPGVIYQPKRITMSITYRATAEPIKARVQLLEHLERVNEPYGFALSEGHTLWEIKPPIAFNKGTALADLVDEFKLDAAIFLGDDRTDIPALERVRALRETGRIKGMAIAVRGDADVPTVRQAADVFAYDVDDVAALLDWLYDHLPAV